jgi:hypothetical protein
MREFGFPILTAAILSMAMASGAQTPGDGAPLNSLNPRYTLVSLMPGGIRPVVSGMDFLSDGRLVVCTWGGDYNRQTPPLTRGELFVISGIDKGDPAQMSSVKLHSALPEPLGLKVVNDTIYMSERQALSAAVDKNGNGTLDAGEYWKVATYASGDKRHQFFFGLVHKDGYLYGNHSTAQQAGGSPFIPQPDSMRGTYVKIDRKTGRTEYIAGGTRQTFGIGLLPDGNILSSETQGTWNPASAFTVVKPGRFYGHPQPNQNPPNRFDAMPYNPPAVLLPQGEISHAPGEPTPIPAGDFRGQVLYGDVTYGGIQRLYLDKVGGEIQGGVVRFSAGFASGIGRLKFAPNGDLIVGATGDPTGNWKEANKSQVWGLWKMVPNGKGSFEILRVVSRPRGMEIHFTEEVAQDANQVSKYVVNQWYYTRTSGYGGSPTGGKKLLQVSSVQVDPSRKKVYLEITGLTPKERVVHIRMSGLKSASGASLWSAETWYTLNALGTGEPFSPWEDFWPDVWPGWPSSAGAVRPDPSLLSVLRGPGGLSLAGVAPAGYEVKVYDIRGSLAASFRGERTGRFLLPLRSLAPGAYTAVLRSGTVAARRTFTAW